MKKLSKNKWLRVFVVTLGIIFILYLLYWRFLNYVPLSQQKYSNTTTHHHYSFSYPKEWVLTECGNGEVVVAKNKVSACLTPLEASKDYINNVYFQTFIPGDKYSQISFKDANPSTVINGWTTMFLSFDDESAILSKIPILDVNEYIKMSGNSFPVKFDTKYDFVDDPRNHYPNHLLNFTIGFYPHPELKEEFDYVMNSVNYNYK